VTLESQAQVKCPECGSERLNKSGFRYRSDGSRIQRYKCPLCRYRFSEAHVKLNVGRQLREVSNPTPNHADGLVADRDFSSEKAVDCLSFNGSEDVASHTVTATEKSLNLLCLYSRERQLGDPRGPKKLETSTTGTKSVGDARKPSVEAQIVNYLIYLKNNGRADSTIEAKDFQLRRLVSLGADLNDPETVKRAIASLDKSESYKLLLSISYEGFASKNGITWTRPAYKQRDKLPFLPHESEIDALIAGCGKKTATLLRLIKETAMRLGEAWQVEWIDFDPENRKVVCNHPEKSSKARAFTVSPELTQMLQALPHNSQFIFTCSRQPVTKEDRKVHLAHIRRPKGLLGKQRMQVARKLKNPRIAQIHFHSLRHWKATKMKHQGFDIFDIAAFLGHRDIKNTVVYVHLEKSSYPDGGDDYTSKAVTTKAEKLALIEAGYEFVSIDPDGTQYFRKRR